MPLSLNPQTLTFPQPTDRATYNRRRVIVMPRATGPSDATRRGVVLDKYRHGDVTSSAKDGQASGAVSATGTSGGSS